MASAGRACWRERSSSPPRRRFWHRQRRRLPPGHVHRHLRGRRRQDRGGEGRRAAAGAQPGHADRELGDGREPLSRHPDRRQHRDRGGEPLERPAGVHHGAARHDPHRGRLPAQQRDDPRPGLHDEPRAGRERPASPGGPAVAREPLPRDDRHAPALAEDGPAALDHADLVGLRLLPRRRHGADLPRRRPARAPRPGSEHRTCGPSTSRARRSGAAASTTPGPGSTTCPGWRTRRGATSTPWGRARRSPSSRTSRRSPRTSAASTS